jgi:hypothetical protein
MHRLSLFFIFFAALVALFFKPFSSFVTHGNFWIQGGEVFGAKLPKHDHKLDQKTDPHSYEKNTMPVDRTQLLDYCHAISSTELKPLPACFNCPASPQRNIRTGIRKNLTKKLPY